MNIPKWLPCVDHRPDDVEGFVADYFGSLDTPCLFIGGAGFDPRSSAVLGLLKESSRELHAFLIKEERSNPDEVLVSKAATSLEVMKSGVKQAKVLQVEIFAQDGAVVGGRSLLAQLEAEPLSNYRDIIVDLSALSIGISFPLVKYLLLRAGQAWKTNLHLFASSCPDLDSAIRSQPGDRASVVHGFRRINEYYGAGECARLWLPQLALGREQVLRRIFDEVKPHDTCPILPFPSSDPKLGDRLAASFRAELDGAWSVDARSIIYAHEEDPLDLYRTILRIDDTRKPAFDEFGGSLLVLSPLGSRMLSIGALMAALDRDLPIYYVEARGYEVDWTAAEGNILAIPSIRHVWLCGDAYPKSDAALI